MEVSTRAECRWTSHHRQGSNDEEMLGLIRRRSEDVIIADANLSDTESVPSTYSSTNEQSQLPQHIRIDAIRCSI
jgi:hypothetical protein